MTISEGEVRHVARLARLRLSDDEVRLYQDQLARVLDHVRELSGLDTDGVPPTSHASAAEGGLREDEPRPFAGRDDLLSNAPVLEGPFLKVPKVIP